MERIGSVSVVVVALMLVGGLAGCTYDRPERPGDTAGGDVERGAPDGEGSDTGDPGERFDSEDGDTVSDEVDDAGGSSPGDAEDAVDGDGGGGASPRLGPPRYLSESDFEFQNEVHAVDDLGMDPTGEEAIDEALDGARASNTLIVFPPGEYKIVAGPDRDATHKWGSEFGDDIEHFGIKGLGEKPGDVQFVVEEQPQGYGGRWIANLGGEGFLLKNFAIQMRRDDYTSADMVLRKDDLLLVEEVEWKGIVPSDNDGTNRLLTAAIRTEAGVGELNRVYMREGSIMPEYPDGMAGVVVGAGHAGTMYVTDPWIENMSSTAVGFRAQNLTGRVGVEGGYFKNNANNNIRGCAGNHPDGSSYIRGATIVIDGENMSDLQPSGEELTSTDALTVNGPEPGYEGLIIEDIDIYFLSAPNGGLVLNRPNWARHGRFTLRDVRVRYEAASNLLTNIESPDLAVDDETARFENVHVTGSGGTLRADEETTAEIVDSCVESDFDIQNFDTVSNVSETGCEEPKRPKEPPER